jgi:hypothetical protein
MDVKNGGNGGVASGVAPVVCIHALWRDLYNITTAVAAGSGGGSGGGGGSAAWAGGGGGGGGGGGSGLVWIAARIIKTNNVSGVIKAVGGTGAAAGKGHVSAGAGEGGAGGAGGGGGGGTVAVFYDHKIGSPSVTGIDVAGGVGGAGGSGVGTTGQGGQGGGGGSVYLYEFGRSVATYTAPSAGGAAGGYPAGGAGYIQSVSF